MSDHKTFCAFGAYAVNVVDPKSTVVIPLASAADLRPDPTKKFDLNRRVELNLQKRLEEAPWDEAILDTLGMEMREDPPGSGNKIPVKKRISPEFLNDVGINVLTIGPLFPGPHVGGVYMERAEFFKQIRLRFDSAPKPPPRNRRWPHAGLRPYQFMSSASREGNTISRYHGFLATVVEDQGSTKFLEIHGVDQVDGNITVKVDMNDRAQCDDPVFLSKEIQDDLYPEEIEIALDAQSKKGDQGAIFLPLELCARIGLSGPKEPPGGGGQPGDGASFQPLRKQPGSVSSGIRTATTSNETFVNIGAPGSDHFTKSVFERSLVNASARKHVIESTGLALRSRLMDLTENLNNAKDSLDIIVDAPGGIQRIGNAAVLAVSADARSILDSLDTGLMERLRARFTQCRLLGCATALDPEMRKRMRVLADALGIPVIGTLRAIAFGDFGDTSFQAGDEDMSIVISTDQMNASGRPRKRTVETEAVIASGMIQQEWLSRYAQVKVGPEDLEGEVPSGAKPWRMPDDLFSSHLAATDQIHTAAAGVVALQTPSGPVRCEVLASATLLRLKSRTHGWVYVNIPWSSNRRSTLWSLISE